MVALGLWQGYGSKVITSGQPVNNYEACETILKSTISPSTLL